MRWNCFEGWLPLYPCKLVVKQMALVAIIWFRSSYTETYGGLCKDFHLSHHFGSLLLTCRSDKQTKKNVIIKTAPDFLLRNERDILKRFQTTPSLRRLIDEVQDPPLLVLEHLDSNLLIESGAKKLQSSEAKHVTKAVLQALAALHEEGIVYTGAWKPMVITYHHTSPHF